MAHANDVLDFQEEVPEDMARPPRLRSSRASKEFDTGAFSYDGAGNVTKMGTHRYVYDLLSRMDEAQVEVPGTGCGEELLLQSGTDSGTVTHESCGTVRAEGSYKVGATGNVTLRAGNRVVLGGGFSVASGGRLFLGTDPALDPEGEPTDASQSFAYDDFGNLLSVTTEREGESPVTRTIGTSGATNRLTVATYDLSGNVTAWAGREYRHDPFNMLWQTKPTNGNGHIFVYDPGDERLWTIDWTAGTGAPSWVSTWTLRDLDGTPLRQFRNLGENTASANWSFHRDYVYRGGGLLAAHTPEGLHHFHLDHLGSPRIITDASGTTLAQHLYFPFGEEATDPGQDPEALKFTGHERDDLDTGGTTADLDYMHRRHYSLHLGRFFSVDPSKQSWDASWPQTWNRYAYALSNPTKYIDPNGQFPIDFQLVDLFTRAVRNVAEFFGGVGQGTIDNTGLSPTGGTSSSSSGAFATGQQLANFVASNPMVVEASLNIDTAVGPSATFGISAVNGTDLYAIVGAGRSLSVSPVSGSITIGVVSGYQGAGSYGGLFTSATALAPVGVSFSANPLSTNSPAALGITFSSDVGVFSQSETYYIPLKVFEEILDSGSGYVLIQGELVRVYKPK